MSGHPAAPAAGAIALYGPWEGPAVAGRPAPQPPAAWTGKDVLVMEVSPGVAPGAARTSVLDELSAWRARPLQAAGQSSNGGVLDLEGAVSAIYEAARGGAGVMVLLPASPWQDALGVEIISRRVEAGDAAGEIALHVVDLSRHDAAPLSLSDVPLDRLAAIMRRLLAPDGCPWDREQTHDTLRPYLVEEVAEALEAIERRQAHTLTDELGDLLLQIAFHAALGEKRGLFGPRDVLMAIESKMMYRHPHVFSDWRVADSGEVLRNWESLKAAGRAEAGGDPDTGKWRPLRKAAVRVAQDAFEVAFSGAQGQAGRLAQAAESLRDQAARLEAAARRTLGGPSGPPEEEQNI